MAIRNIRLGGDVLFFVADDMGMPVSFGYPTQAQAEEVAALIDSSGGLATTPPGVSIEDALASSRELDGLSATLGGLGGLIEALGEQD